MCVGNIYEPQAGVDVTKVPTERDRLKLFDATVTPRLLRNVYDDGKNEEEAPDNATTDDEDDHTHKEKNT